MKYSFFIGFLLLFLLLSCDDANPKPDEQDLTQEEELQNLETMLQEIQSLAQSVSCQNTSEWTFTSYGSKACGGPVGYIAFSKTIDVFDFLKKVEAHRQAEEAFNKKWGIISDCALAVEPTGISCVNGSPIFVYE